MKQNVYTFIGCCLAAEHQIRKHGEPSAEVGGALSSLVSIRDGLLEAVAAPDDISLETALNEHVTSLLEVIEIIRSSDSYAFLDHSLVELLDYYYNIGDSLMGGGGSPGWGIGPGDPSPGSSSRRSSSRSSSGSSSGN